MSALTVLCGDALAKLRELPDESVQCCVTSPPFWGLRDYGTGKWEGGAEDCNHTPRPQITGTKTDSNAGALRDKPSRDCKCGARRIDAQLGLEKTPEEYVAKLVEVFREVRRVLRKDGTLWLNLGDSYARSPARGIKFQAKLNGNGATYLHNQQATEGNRGPEVPIGCKEKDLVGIPWMVAFALRADGWWLRSDIIWAKPNPMPESVTDRPTKSHEYIFLLTKSARYFYDAEAIKEAVTWDDRRLYDPEWEPLRKDRDQIGTASRGGGPLNPKRPGLPDFYKGSIPGRNGGPGQDRRSQNDRGSKHRDQGESQSAGIRIQENTYAARDATGSHDQAFGYKRNKRSVWRVATNPYPDAHFATYPPDLIKPCILAGSRVGDTILDPFGGSGTTGQVALELGRRAILIELNPKYVALIEKRCSVTLGLGLSSFARDAQTSTRDARAPRKEVAA